ncbi:MAG: hypothetical protein KJ592_00905 [Nanoarchaeota archaeon]|nr:hypothetical protein [Nanoarchaeota archaeon]
MENAKIIKTYSCSLCNKVFNQERGAQEHITKLPRIDNGLAISLVIRNNREDTPKEVIILEEGNKIDKRDHGRIQPCEIDGYTTSINSAYTKRGLKNGNCSLLTQEEFEKFYEKYQASRRTVYLPLRRSTTELEALTNQK